MKVSCHGSRALSELSRFITWHKNTPTNGNRGFTLIQISILLTVAALVLVTLLPSTQTILTSNTSTITKMNTLLTAIRQFQAANGRLPCPADASQPISSTSYGLEAANPGPITNCSGGSPAANYTDTTHTIAIGMVPVRALALSNDYALDAYGRDITYAVDTNATTLGWSAVSLTGQIVVADNGANNNTVVALISHGADGHGAWLPLPGTSGTAVRLNAGSGDHDQHYVNAHAVNPSGFPASYSTLNTLVANSESTTSTFVNKAPTSTFDDLVVYKSLLWNINNIPASVPRVTVVTSPASNCYSTGAVLTFVLTYNEAVTVTTTGGTPYLSLSAITGNMGTGNIAKATYQNGSGTTNLTFSYTIQASDYAPNGITVAPSVIMNGGTIMNGTAYSVIALTAPNLTTDTVNAGNIYISDDVNDVVRMVNSAGIISTAAGNGTSGYSGDGGPATSAELSAGGNGIGQVAADSSGNFYVNDVASYRVRKVNTSGIIATVAGNGTNASSGNGGPATSAAITGPYGGGVAVDSAGNLYIADYYGYAIRKVVAATGIITTVAGGSGYGFSGDGGLATSAQISYPGGIKVDSAGNIYITDYYNYRIRKVTASTGIITTVAGNGTSGYTGDGGLATSAEINPGDVAVDNAGNLYIADAGNAVVRKVNTSGIISTFAGTGVRGYSCSSGPASGTALNTPTGIATDNAGNLYIADYGNQCIREVNTFGNISTVAGNGTAGLSGNGGPATSAELYYPGSVAIGCSR